MRGRALVAFLALSAVVFLSGCGRERVWNGRDLPRGDAIWFEQGITAADTDVSGLLVQGGYSGVFLPAVRFGRGEGGGWVAQGLPPPPHPLARPPVFLVIDGGGGVGSALETAAELPAMGDALWLAAKGLLHDGIRFGNIRGIHLDLPFSAAGLQGYRTLVSNLRARLAPAVLLTLSVRSAYGPDDQEKLRGLAVQADGLLAFVFGEGNGADPVSTDALGEPWWSGYTPAARGFWTDAQGKERGLLSEGVLARLTDNRGIDVAQNLALKEESDSLFLLKPRQPVSDGEHQFNVGDRLSFRQPAVSDMIYRLGADLAGRRRVRGRVVVLTGSSESDRIFPLAALNDVLLGRSVVPDLRVSVEQGHDFLRVSAKNVSPHASVISSVSNWVEVEIPTGGVRDVFPGGFDRFEVFASDGRRVTLGRATRVRFHELLIQPFEKIEPARIALRRPAPAGCCATRVHALAASGSEVSGDGKGPAQAQVGKR